MKKIYINPGHSDRDPGAVGYEIERELNVKVSTYMNAYLLANYECETRMNPGTMGGLYDICNDANKWGANLFVSNHFNAAGGDGYEALVYSKQRIPLGEIFAKHVAEAGQNLRMRDALGVSVRPGLVVLRDTEMPAVLNEGAFVDNLKDIQDWNEDHELKKLGEAYAKAAAEYLKLEKKAVPEAPAEPEPVPEPYVQVSLLELSKGSEGPQVKTLQRLLAAMGYYKSTIDGDFGNLTEAAVKAFQRTAGIVQDGIVGQQTWSKLLGIA